MKEYIKRQTILSVVMIFIQILARVVINYSPFLACDDNGMVWLQTEILGAFFITFHMMCICMQALMIMKVYYSIPNKLGYFDQEKRKKILEERSMKSESVKLLGDKIMAHRESLTTLDTAKSGQLTAKSANT